MTEFKQYRRKQIAELRPYKEGEDLLNLLVEASPGSVAVSISEVDRLNGSPRAGDMIARNPKNHLDQWLVAEQYFKDNFEEVMNEFNQFTVDELIRRARAMVDRNPSNPNNCFDLYSAAAIGHDNLTVTTILLEGILKVLTPEQLDEIAEHLKELENE